MEQVGKLSTDIINLLNLNIAPNTPILIGDSNIDHIKARHPYEYDMYYDRIPEILETPDFVGINPNNNSIQFVKFFYVVNEYIRVAVKISTNKMCFVKSMHLLSTFNAERYIQKGTLKKLDNTSL
ncbi:MAG: transposase [Lachnospiraceae bacterium]|nr:transposase [Lachnospiraceae bacterium]